jgi:RNA-binding protein YlmH
MSIYQHFRDDEKPFIDEVSQWCDGARERYVSKLTDFLDPRRQDIAASVIGNDEEVTLSFCGGSHRSERKRLLILPPYAQVDEGDYNLVLFSVHYPKKFATITHRELLGSLMGLGLKREKFGDLLLMNDEIQFVVAKEIAPYVKMNLTSVGKTPVEISETPLSDIIKLEEKWDEQAGTVSSLRLDTVLSDIHHFSRAKIVPFIENGRVKVNWKVVEQTSYPLHEGDYLSVRGLGRSKLIKVQGKTKKDKWRIVVGKRI